MARVALGLVRNHAVHLRQTRQHDVKRSDARLEAAPMCSACGSTAWAGARSPPASQGARPPPGRHTGPARPRPSSSESCAAAAGGPLQAAHRQAQGGWDTITGKVQQGPWQPAANEARPWRDRRACQHVVRQPVGAAVRFACKSQRGATVSSGGTSHKAAARTGRVAATRPTSRTPPPPLTLKLAQELVAAAVGRRPALQNPLDLRTLQVQLCVRSRKGELRGTSAHAPAARASQHSTGGAAWRRPPAPSPSLLDSEPPLSCSL